MLLTFATWLLVETTAGWYITFQFSECKISISRMRLLSLSSTPNPLSHLSFSSSSPLLYHKRVGGGIWSLDVSWGVLQEGFRPTDVEGSRGSCNDQGIPRHVSALPDCGHCSSEHVQGGRLPSGSNWQFAVCFNLSTPPLSHAQEII